MKNKNIIIGAIISIMILGGTFLLIKLTPIDDSQIKNKIETPKHEDEKNLGKELEFLKEISGVKANEIELIDNPVGLKGEFIAPRESIIKGVDYFLRDTENSKIEDIQIDIGDGYIYLRTTYKINSLIKTPIEVKVSPYVDKSKNLVLQVYDFKFLDLKIADWIVNIGVESFVKDWYPKDKEIKVNFEDNKVIIDKGNFESLILNDISIDKDGLKVNMVINLEKII